MSRLKATYLRNESATVDNIVLNSDGSVGGELGTTLANKLPGEVASSAPATATAGKVWVDSGTKQGFFGTGSAWVPFTGKILQVVSTSTTASFATTSTSYVDWTGLSVTLTPSATTSKILVLVSVGGATATVGPTWTVGIARGATTVASQQVNSAYAGGYSDCLTINYLDTPSTTSAVTYKVQLKIGGSGSFTSGSGITFTITAMEVAA